MYLNEKEIKPGMLVRAKFKVNPDNDIWGEYYLPLEIVEEYRHFFRCLVLPHRNPGRCWETSHLYPMTINKKNLRLGLVKVKDYYAPTGIEAP